MSVAREPCSERKFQSHPTVPPGRLIELAFAAVYRGEECSVNCSGELNPMISPTESSRVAACKSMGLPHLIVALGAPGRARRDVRDGPAAIRVTRKACPLRAKQPRRGGSQLWCSADAR